MAVTDSATRSGSDGGERLTADARRESLLDVSREMVIEAGPSSVTMGSVAERAQVTRALVYKHFDNKDDLLLEVYRREAGRLDRRIRRHVVAADEGLEPKLRALVTATLDGVAEHGPFFTPLRDVGAQRSAKADQRGWDRRTVRYFSGLAEQEYALPAAVARSAMGVQLTGLQSLFSQARGRSAARRRELEEIYVDGVLGAFDRLSRRHAG